MLTWAGRHSAGGMGTAGDGGQVVVPVGAQGPFRVLNYSSGMRIRSREHQHFQADGGECCRREARSNLGQSIGGQRSERQR